MSRFFGLLIATLSRSLFNVFYQRIALDSANWIKIFLESLSRTYVSSNVMSLWLFCSRLWASLCPVRSKSAVRFYFLVVGMFEFLLRKFKQLWAIYHFFKPEEVSQTQDIRETFTNFFFWQLISKPGCVLVVFFVQMKIYSI